MVSHSNKCGHDIVYTRPAHYLLPVILINKHASEHVMYIVRKMDAKPEFSQKDQKSEDDVCTCSPWVGAPVHGINLSQVPAKRTPCPHLNTPNRVQTCCYLSIKCPQSQINLAVFTPVMFYLWISICRIWRWQILDSILCMRTFN